jgi:hypothetical protein
MVLLRCWVRSAADGMDDEVEASRSLQGAESDESVTLIFKAVITRNLVTASQPQIWIRRTVVTFHVQLARIWIRSRIADCAFHGA